MNVFISHEQRGMSRTATTHVANGWHHFSFLSTECCLPLGMTDSGAGAFWNTNTVFSCSLLPDNSGFYPASNTLPLDTL
jgi:hypothetical protein